MRKVILSGTITHDGIEHHPGLHEVDDKVADKWLKELPGIVRETRRDDPDTPGKRIDLNAALKDAPITGREI